MKEGGLHLDCLLSEKLKFVYDGNVILKHPILQLGASRLFIRQEGREVHNHDWRKNEYTDKVFDLTEPWPIQSNTYGLIVGFHVLEHIPVKKALFVMQEAHRCVANGGGVIIEVPDILGVCKELQEGNFGMLECMYGLDRYPGDNHRWGYTKSALQMLFLQAGFERTLTSPGKCYHKTQQAVIRGEGVCWVDSEEIDLAVPSVQEQKPEAVPGPGQDASGKPVSGGFRG
jgi:predicted SAM-dependent methyltransferase